MDPKALKIAFELGAYAHSTLQRPVVQEVVAAPLGFFFSFRNKRLIDIEVRQMVTLFDGKLSARAFRFFLIPLMLYPYGTLETNHGGNGEYFTQTIKRRCRQ